MRILLVDDDPEILGLVTQFLTLSTDHDVCPARSAKEALEAIATAETPFDCVLADIQMPTVDGIALVQMIRQTPGYDHTPIIMLTAMQDRDHLDRAFFSGASDYLTKPFDFQHLLTRLHETRKLAECKARARTAVPGEGDFRGMGDDPKDMVLSHPIPLPGVASALDYCEFENYVGQLVRRQLFRISALAVKIDKVDRVYAATTSEAFKKLLADVATAIEHVLLADGGALSYRGNGVFLCLPETGLKSRRNNIQTALNKRLATVLAPTGNPAPKLVVGDLAPIRTASEAEALDTLASVIDNVENHAFTAADMYEVHGRLMKQQRFNEEQRRLEKRAFETMLRDPDTPPADDAWTKRLFRRSGRPAGA